MKETYRYKDAGVDIDAANNAVSKIKRLAASTFTPNNVFRSTRIGGMFRPDVMVSNLLAVAQEVLIMLPVAVIAYLVHARRLRDAPASPPWGAPAGIKDPQP